MSNREANRNLPASFGVAADSAKNSAKMPWREFFKDPYLASLIDSALKNNQELNITIQEIEIAKNEVRAKKGEILPSVGYRAGIGAEKVGLYTSQGAGDASADITPGKKVPELLGDFQVGLTANWEVDIWHKLRNAKKAAVSRYLSTIEGKNFVVTNLVAEIANSYYELLALDNQLNLVRNTISLQNNALSLVKIQKEAARVTELAVRKFEAEVLNSKSLEFSILQNITETEIKINFLVGRLPQKIQRSSSAFESAVPEAIYSGIPMQLLNNRPDIRQAELELTASKIDLSVAKAQFYPSLGLSASLGLQAFNPTYLFRAPESILYGLAADLAGPLVNKNAIKANYSTANAKQVQAVYTFEKTVLNAYLETVNELSNLSNLQKVYGVKADQAKALNESVSLANDLFRSARADYLEVLMTQRDALEAKLSLIEVKQRQFAAAVNLYKALGGGWN